MNNIADDFANYYNGYDTDEYLISVFIFSVKVTKWAPIGKMAAHSAYDMYSLYKYLIISLFFFPPRYLEWESFSDGTFSCSLPTCTFFRIKCIFYLLLYDVDLHPSVYSAYLKLNTYHLDKLFESEAIFPYIKIKAAILTTILLASML